MPVKLIKFQREIYQIKLTLLDTKPPIWRRLLVPSDMTLERLHIVLQAAMGWENRHLHDFRIGQKRFGNPDPEDRRMGLPATGDERIVRLFSVLGKVGAKAIYNYDFGDDWEHELVVEKVLPPEPSMPYPVCVSGQRNGPPEDCGGIPGFYHFLAVMRNLEHKDHAELREWIGDDYDPEAFSINEVNRRLALLGGHGAKHP